MKLRSVIGVVGLALWISVLWAQNLPSVSQPGVPVQNGALRLMSPKMDDRIAQNSVRVQYELTNPGVAASPSPTFRIQMDNQDPVDTTTTDHTFIGLQPGVHSVTVTLIDANGVPIQGSSATARFFVLPQRSSRTVPEPEPPAADASAKPAAGPAEEPSNGNSALPILSVIGFGVLVGGIFSAMRSR